MSISLIPDSAPFNEEQRAWLNGFLAGWTGIVDGEQDNGDFRDGSAVAASLMPGSSDEPAEEEEEFPWHDPSIEIDERLQLAEGKPVKRKLMAAMAQLNCGACGYLCQTYSEAIASGDEKNLKLCSPGGKETAKAIKRLVKEQASEPSDNPNPESSSASNSETSSGIASQTSSGFCRANPYSAVVISSDNQNLDGSSKHTSHVVIDLGDSGIDYNVGDSLGVYPTNCSDLVDEIVAELGQACTDDQRRQLIEMYCLRTVTDELLNVMVDSTDDVADKSAIAELEDSDELDGMDVLDILRRFASVDISVEVLLSCLMEITPRLYSIASSHRAHPGEVHLTVGRATASVGDRLYKGVASTMFADRIQAGDTVRVYVHPSHGFTVPSDPSAPMIMVGPGTGIAPFRAFLQERSVVNAPGNNWLFYGDQHSATDFLYREELDDLLANGRMTKLSVAFSRDQKEKVYVQDRMREQGAELFEWLEQGAYFFVCGDAKRMAADVDRVLHEVVASHGNLGESEAAAYIHKLKSTKRYSRDVY